MAAIYALAGKKVFVAGHRGMVGSALLRRLAREDCEIVTAGREALDLRDQSAVRAFLADRRCEVVILAAAKVGGILANARHPADFIADNLAIQSNVIDGAFRAGTEKLLFLGSSCIYPKHAPQPIPEDALLTGPLEPTNQWYAVAKIAGLKLCEAYREQHGADFISAMPTNLYGPGDNFDPVNSHVIPALIRRAHEAAERGDAGLTIWGSGTPRREFLHVDDAADALVHLLRCYSGALHINVGSGEDIAIRDLARLVCDAVGFRGSVSGDPSMPNGTPRKLLDVSRLAATGWRARIGLPEGLADTVAWFRSALKEGAARLSVG
jgi:GDP-L-fucose synthase